MDCPVCLVPYENDNVYVIGCGSKDRLGNEVKHTICNDCEHTLRINSPLVWLNGQFSRIIKCVLCRQPELDLTKRTVTSLMKELSASNATVAFHEQILVPPPPDIYIPLATAPLIPRGPRVPRVPAPAVPRVPRVPRVRDPGSAIRQWCVKRNNGCTTKGKTPRNCSTDGCLAFVCRSCRVC